MANNLVKWSALGTFTTALLGADVAPTLKNLSSAARKISDAIDAPDAANRYLYSDWHLKCRFASAPAAGAYVEIYFVRSVDGTNYEDGSDSLTPSALCLAARVPVRAVNTQQEIAIPRLVVPAVKFKVLLVNSAGQALTNTDGENLLSYRFYTEDIVTP